MGLAECEAQLRKMRHFLGLPARRLEEDRRPDPPVNVPQRPFGIRVERPGVRLLASNVRVNCRDEARLAKLTEYDTPKSGLGEWCRSERDEWLRASLAETLLRRDRDPLR